MGGGETRLIGEGEGETGCELENGLLVKAVRVVCGCLI
jgi:hypothetical protein